MSDCHQLLEDYVKNGSETAFSELVTRYVDLVYSAAVRLVNGDTHLAEDVTQTVFNDLARKARGLSSDVMLGGWLHRHTCFIAMNLMRGERRRQIREREAIAMQFTQDHSADNLAIVAPLLDDAIDRLSADDRKAILLRFFEQHDFAAVGHALGTSEEAARKRVHRALEKLHLLLQKRGVVFSAAGLGTALSQQAVTAAPVGLATSVAATAFAGAVGVSTTFAFLTIMSTKIKIAVIGAIIVAVAVPLAMQQQAHNKLRAENEALRRQAERASQLSLENQRLAKVVERKSGAAASTNEQFREVLKLRGEVGRLRTAASVPKTNGPSALSAMKADTNMWNTVRNQQKAGLGMIYKEFAKREKISKEKTEQLSNLHADGIMDNIDLITKVLSEGKTLEEAEPLFAEQDAALMKKVEDLLGADKVGPYQDYTRDLLPAITTEQFKGMLTGTKEDKAAKSKQLLEVLREESQVALASAGLSPDYQTVPMLNLRNIAFEQQAEKSLKLMQDIYENTTARAASFLTPAEIEKFKKFQTEGLSNNRMGLTLNRKLMAPETK